MVSGAVRVITDHGIGISTMEVLLDPSILAKLAPAIAIALALYLGLRHRKDSPYVLPSILLAGLAAAHLAFAISGTSLPKAGCSRHRRRWGSPRPGISLICARSRGSTCPA
jgi:sulfate permease, SulP family